MHLLATFYTFHPQDLDEHIVSPGHSHVVNIQSYWAKLDMAIGLANMNSDDSVYEHSEGGTNTTTAA